MFRIGDEVVCVDDTNQVSERPLVNKRTYIVSGRAGNCGLYLHGVVNRGGDWEGHNPNRFRKVQKRNSSLSYESFLTIKPGFEEPRRVNTPAKERVA